MHKIKHGIAMLVSAIILLILISTLFFHSVEGWNWVDSMYATILTITTVGHSELIPQQVSSKIFSSIIAFVGIAMVLTLFGIISSLYVRKFCK